MRHGTGSVPPVEGSMMLKRAILPALLLLAAGASPAAPKGSFTGEMSSWTDEKLAKKVTIHKGSAPNAKGEGPTPNLAKLDAPPRRVALVSFYTIDAGKAKNSPVYRYSPGPYVSITEYGRQTSTYYLTPDGAAYFSEKLYERGIDSLKAAFASQKMELLTPNEYLDTPEKRSLYAGYDLKLGFASKMSKTLQDAYARMGGGDTRVSAVAPGYRLFPIHLAPTDPATAVNMNDLRQKLGVDALLAVANTTMYDGKEVHFTGMVMEMFGPNPVPKVEGKMYIQYKEGQNYASAQVNFGDKGGWIAQMKDDDITAESYDGYEKLLGAVGSEVAVHVASAVAR